MTDYRLGVELGHDQSNYLFLFDALGNILRKQLTKTNNIGDY